METTFDYDSDPDNIMVVFKSLGTGKECRIAIPKEGSREDTDGTFWRDNHLDTAPYGLNLVYSPPGYHYQ